MDLDSVNTHTSFRLGEMWEVCSCSGRGRSENREKRRQILVFLSLFVLLEFFFCWVFFALFWGLLLVSVVVFFFFLFLHALVFNCISLIQILLSKMVHIILQKWRNGPHHPNTGETGVLPTAVPGPLQMFASCCSGAIQGWQLIQPCSAGLQCSAEGAGNATNGDK